MKRSILLVLTLVLLLVLAPFTLAAGTGETENPGDHARFYMNGTIYSIFQDENGQQHVTSDASEGDTELPEGVSYDLEANTLTLNGAQLDVLDIFYEVTDETGNVVDYWLPSPALTIVLEGESTISAPSNHGMFIANGVNATVTGDANSALTLSVPASDGARAIRVEQNCTLTIAGETSVTATITGSVASEGYVEVIAMGVYHSDLTVQDKATLTATADQVENNYSIDVVSGTMTVTDSGTVNANSTLALGRYEETDPLGKFVMDENSCLNIVDHDAGLMLNGAEVTVSGGDLDIDLTAPTDYETYYDDDGNPYYSDYAWTDGIACNGSTLDISGGNVTIDFPNGNGICLDAAWGENNTPIAGSSLTQSGGTLTITANAAAVESYAIAMRDMMPSNATFTGGTTELKAIKGLEVGQKCELTIRNDADILVNGIVPSYSWWGLNSISGTLNIYGGALTVTANKAIALEISGSYNQSGGVVTLRNGGWETKPSIVVDTTCIFEGKQSSMSISGGKLDVTSQYMGMYISGDFSLLNGTVNTYGGDRGVMIMDASVTLAGGSFNASSADQDTAAATYVAQSAGNHAALSITGGTHSFLAPISERTTYGLVADGSVVSFTGGASKFTGNCAILWQGWKSDSASNTEDGSNQITIAGNLHAVSNRTGNALQFVHSTEKWDGETYYFYSFTEDSTLDGNTCTDVTISSEEGQAPSGYTGSMEITSGQATVGAPVVIKYTVVIDGTVSIELPAGLELIEGSLSVNGVSVSQLKDIPVRGAAVIRFSVKPLEEGDYTITATATSNTGTYQTSLPVSASGFQATAPSVTKVPLIYVSGYGTPGDKITLDVSSANTISKTYEGVVSSQGTFKIPVDLPVASLLQKETFTIKVYFTKGRSSDPAATLTVTYDPDSVSVTILSITNIVHSSHGIKVPVTIDVDYVNNKVLQSYYTYWPDEPLFEYAVEFDVPDGWEIRWATIHVTLQDGTKKEVELEEPGPGDRNHWKGELDLGDRDASNPPVNYQIFWGACPVASQAAETQYTGVQSFLPIMDPSGTIYSGTLDNPVPGATVTLYFGGNGKTADAANAYVFDMTNYGQVNPQVSDALGNYAWNVPEGWWQIVATYEQDGRTYTAKSEWLHVLPIQEGVGLNLNLPTVDPDEPDTPHKPSGGTSATTPSQPTQTFRDVSKSSYYYDAVTWAVENGVTDGTGSNTFSPDKACTRAEIVTFLWRAAGKPAAKSRVNPFTDVSKSAYYYDAVLWAVEAGITQGTSATTFSPDKTCSRAEAVTFLFRAASGKASSGTVPFTDVPANAYYKDAVLWAVAENVTQGTGSSTFSPDKTCSRAEIVTFLYRSPLSE